MAATPAYDLMTVEALAGANPTWKIKFCWVQLAHYRNGLIHREDWTRIYLHRECLHASNKVQWVMDKGIKFRFEVGARIGVGTNPICGKCRKPLCPK